MFSNECSIVQYQWAWIIVDYSTTVTKVRTHESLFISHIYKTHIDIFLISQQEMSLVLIPELWSP